MQNQLLRLLPRGSAYGNRLTFSGRQMLVRLIVSILALIAGIVALFVLAPSTWREVLAGLSLGWGVASLVWARSSYSTVRDAAYQDLRRMAELDLLLARLNQISQVVGAPRLNLHQNVEAIVNARIERLAHFSSLDEFRPSLDTEGGYAFWDASAMGDS